MLMTRKRGRTSRRAAAPLLLLGALLLAGCMPAEGRRYREHQATVLEPMRGSPPAPVRTALRPIDRSVTRR